MYQAIVFLPLLGAILAGLISLAGARARHPGGSPDAGADTHAGAHAADGHAHAAPSPHGAVSAIHRRTRRAARARAGRRRLARGRS